MLVEQFLKADMLVQDALLPDWHLTNGQTVIDEYFYDPLQPKEFYVYPLRLLVLKLVLILVMCAYCQRLPQQQTHSQLMIILRQRYKSGCFTQYGAAMMSNHLTTVRHKPFGRRF